MPILVPPQMGDVILGTVQALNGGDDAIQIIMIAVKTDEPPVLVSSIPPDQMHDVFQWLLDHRDSVTTEVHPFVDGKPETKQ